MALCFFDRKELICDAKATQIGQDRQSLAKSPVGEKLSTRPKPNFDLFASSSETPSALPPEPTLLNKEFSPPRIKLVYASTVAADLMDVDQQQENKIKLPRDSFDDKCDELTQFAHQRLIGRLRKAHAFDAFLETKLTVKPGRFKKSHVRVAVVSCNQYKSGDTVYLTIAMSGIGDSESYIKNVEAMDAIVRKKSIKF